jgi:peptide/nickel transport system substrate-binding protein
MNVAFTMKLLLLAMLAVACRDVRHGPPRPQHEPSPPEASAPETTARVWVDVEPAHLNPLVLPDEWCFRIGLGPIYQPLVLVDAAGRAVPGGLAASVIEDADRSGLSVGLRGDAVWHDGRPVTASDVAFTYEAILDPRNGLETLRRELGDLHMVELSAADPRLVRLRLHRPDTYLAAALAEIPILPRHVFSSENGRIDWLRHPATRKPVGSGPYRLQEWKRGQRIVLKLADPTARPKGALEEIVYAIQADGAAALGALRRDELDVLSRVLPVHYPDEALTPLTLKRFREVRLRPGRWALVLWNLRRPPLGDARVRRALAEAIDRPALLADVRHGLGRLIAAPGLDSPQPLPYDAAAAGRWFDESGLHRGKPDGPRLSGKTPWRMELLAAARAPIAEDQTRRIAADLGKQGVLVTPRFVEQGDLFGRLKKGMFDAAVLTFASRADADLSPLLGTGGALNYGGLSDAEVDRALEDLRRLPSGAERDGARLRLGRRLQELEPALFLYAVEEEALVRRTLPGIVPSGDWLDLLHATALPGQVAAGKPQAR